MADAVSVCAALRVYGIITIESAAVFSRPTQCDAPDFGGVTKMRRIFCLSALVFLLPGVLLSCGGSASAGIADAFTELLDRPASEQSIEEANDFLKANLTRLNREQAGELLLLLEGYALNYDNGSIDYERLIAEYAAEIPDSLTELFEYKAVEQLRPIIFDATLRVGWE